MRSPPVDLEPVADDDEVLFFVSDFDASARVDRRILSASMKARDFLPSPKNYGQSVYVHRKRD